MNHPGRHKRDHWGSSGRGQLQRVLQILSKERKGGTTKAAVKGKTFCQAHSMPASKSCILGILALAKETRLQMLHLYPHMTLMRYAFKLLSSFCHLLTDDSKTSQKSQALKICPFYWGTNTWWFTRYPDRTILQLMLEISKDKHL